MPDVCVCEREREEEEEEEIGRRRREGGGRRNIRPSLKGHETRFYPNEGCVYIRPGLERLEALGIRKGDGIDPL